MLEKSNMREALPHIERAHRCLEMLAHFAENKERLSLQKRVPTYYNELVESVIALQSILLTDIEYTTRVGHGIATVSQKREYSYNVTLNNDGAVFYSLEAMLPLREMKKNVLFSGKYDDGQPLR